MRLEAAFYEIFYRTHAPYCSPNHILTTTIFGEVSSSRLKQPGRQQLDYDGLRRLFLYTVFNIQVVRVSNRRLPPIRMFPHLPVKALFYIKLR